MYKTNRIFVLKVKPDKNEIHIKWSLSLLSFLPYFFLQWWSGAEGGIGKIVNLCLPFFVYSFKDSDTYIVTLFYFGSKFSL